MPLPNCYCPEIFHLRATLLCGWGLLGKIAENFAYVEIAGHDAG
jgi:hypothetical protein